MFLLLQNTLSNFTSWCHFPLARAGRFCRASVPAAMFAVGLCIAPPLLADKSQTRYVDVKGQDQGDCLNLYRPCRSPAYALRVSSKTDYVYVAAGEYVMQSAADIRSVGDAAHRLVGGFQRVGGYTKRDETQFISTLVGLPPLYREALQDSGFKVIADTKALVTKERDALAKTMASVEQTRGNHTAQVCESNMAAGFPCEGINLKSHIDLASLRADARSANDIWGFVDLNNHREYALIGLSTGMAVVDVSVPEAPVLVGSVEGAGSLWRDIKVFQHYDAQAKRFKAYAYVSNESANGVAVVDLTALPNDVSLLRSGGGFNSAHNVYLANTDMTFGVALPGLQPLLSVAGADAMGGSFMFYDVSQADKPEFMTTSNRGYMHDAASTRIFDSRKDTQCFASANLRSCEVFADFNEQTVDVYDITEPMAPQLLAQIQYSGAQYVHSGWWSEDGQFLFVQDELDELGGIFPTRLRVFNMQDLRKPALHSIWEGPTVATDHNGFVKGNRYYMSNYVEGLTVLDISDPGALARVAYFDTVPGRSDAEMIGAWGVYPFFYSNTVVVSDIGSGLFVLEDNALQSAVGTVSFASATLSASEGDALDITVTREGGSTGSAEVAVEILPLNGGDDEVSWPATGTEQHALAAGRVQWADGEEGAKTLRLAISSDSETEGLEKWALVLKQPSAGLNLNSPRISVLTVSDTAADAALGFVQTDVNVQAAMPTALVNIQRLGNVTQAASVDLIIEYPQGSLLADDSQALAWSAGEASAKTVLVPIESAGLGNGAEVHLRLENAVGAQVEISSAIIRTKGQSNGGGDDTDGIVRGSSGGGGAFAWSSLTFALLLVGWLGLIRTRRCLP